MEPHPDLAPLLPLVGTWTGEGHGEYPTIATFGYREELVVAASPKPFLVVSHRTWAIDDGRPLHVETGYWRVTPAGLEAVIAHPFGAAEVLAGTIETTTGGLRLRLRSTAVTTTGTAKRIDATARELDVDGDRLESRLAMAAVGLPLTHHLVATLTRAA